MEEELFTSQEQIIEALVYGLIFLVLVTLGLILFFYYSRKKIIEKEIEKINIKLDYQERIHQTTIKVQEAERHRISQDLHDAISSKLNIISLTTHVLIEDQTMSTKNKEALKHILDITNKTLENSRVIAHKLMPPILDKFGLKEALEELFEEFTSNSSLKIEQNIVIDCIKKEDELHIFRIIQELINNSLVHGKATILKLDINKKGDFLKLKYEDNGIGFNTNDASKKSGIGLQNIKSRVAILNGIIEVSSTKNKGSLFAIKFRNYD